MGDFENGKLYNWIEDTKVIDKEIKVNLSQDEMLLPKEDFRDDFIIATESHKEKSELSDKRDQVRKQRNEALSIR